MKRCCVCALLVLLCSVCLAQGGSAFQFLRLPVSARVAALGGENISAIADDPALAYHNPALLSWSSERLLGFGYMTYMQGTTAASASCNFRPSSRSALAFGGRYMGFGRMKHTDAGGEILGDFGAKDMALTAVYSYDLNDTWSGGVTTSVIYSNYDVVWSLAVGVDLGVTYCHPDNGFSFSLLAARLGGQVRTYDGTTEPLPTSIVAGVSQRLAHAPIRFSLTLPDLNRWSPSDGYGTPLTPADLLLRHLVVGAELFPTDNLWLGIGYNHRLHSELSPGRRSLAGCSLGGGIDISRLRIAVSYSRYHVAANSLLMHISYAL
jgi:hypothetical protein